MMEPFIYGDNTLFSTWFLFLFNDLIRSALAKTAGLFYEFYRLLQYATECRPLFWLYHQAGELAKCDENVFNRYLQCIPLTVIVKDGAELLPRYFWSNLPVVNKTSINLCSTNFPQHSTSEVNVNLIFLF